MIRFSCPKCDTSLKSADDKAGTKTTCPRCGERLLVPAASESDPKSGGGSKSSGKNGGAAKKGTKTKDKAANQKKKSSPAIYVGVGVVALALVGAGAAFFLMSEKKTEPTKTAEAPPVPQPAPPIQNVAARNPGPSAPGRSTSASTRAVPPTEAASQAVEAKPSPSPPPTADATVLETASLQGEQVYKKLLKSTAWLFSKKKLKLNNLNLLEIGQGSGSLIDKQNKLIVTNYHVIKGVEQGNLIVFFPEYAKGQLNVNKIDYLERAVLKSEGIPAWVEYQDQRRDLAIVKLGGEVPEGIEPIRFAKSPARPGERVHSLGNPGVATAMWVYTLGTVRAFPHHFKFPVSGPDKKDAFVVDATIVETTNPINPGDSGGPLVNDHGELVAVTESSATGAQLMNVFMDISEVRHVLSVYYKSKDLKQPRETAPPAEEQSDVASLIRSLENPDPPKRSRAAEVLGEVGPDAKAAIPYLVKLLKDKDDGVRRNSAQAILQIGSLTQGDLPGLVVAIKDSNADVRVSVISAIKQMGSEADVAVPALIEALHDPQTPVRIQAAKALGAMGGYAKGAIPALAKALEGDKSPDMRAESVLALAKMGPDARAALPSLELALKDPNLDVRLGILAAIQSIGPDAKVLVPLLVKTMKEKNTDYRRALIKTLGAIGPDGAKDSIEPLIQRPAGRTSSGRRRGSAR